MKQLFKKKADSEKRVIRLPILLTAEENEKIRNSASIRKMSVAEFMRRSALRRKSDVRYEEEIVLKLDAVVRGLLFVHRETIAKGATQLLFCKFRFLVLECCGFTDFRVS